MDNKKVEVVFEEEKGLKDRGKEETKKNTNTSERIMRDSLSRAGPRPTADYDDSCSNSSSSSDSPSSSPSSRCSSPITLRSDVYANPMAVMRLNCVLARRDVSRS